MIYDKYKTYTTEETCYYIIKCKVNWLYVVFCENKVTKLLIQKFSFFKCGFRRNINLNEYGLKWNLR